jgi:hypothetical protein
MEKSTMPAPPQKKEQLSKNNNNHSDRIKAK